MASMQRLRRIFKFENSKFREWMTEVSTAISEGFDDRTHFLICGLLPFPLGLDVLTMLTTYMLSANAGFPSILCPNICLFKYSC